MAGGEWVGGGVGGRIWHLRWMPISGQPGVDPRHCGTVLISSLGASASLPSIKERNSPHPRVNYFQSQSCLGCETYLLAYQLQDCPG